MATKFEDVSFAWVEEKRNYVKLSTICVYETILQKHLIPYFKSRKSITEKDVQSFVIYKLEKELSIKSVKDMLVVLQMIGHYSVKKGIMKVEMMDITFPTCESVSKIQVMNKLDEKRLLEYLTTNFSFENLGLLICMETGMRIGEICGLKWEDVSLADSEIRINRTVERIYLNLPNEKTRLIIQEPKTISSKRNIPLCNSLLKVLRPLKKVMNDSFYLVSNNVSPMEPRLYRSRFQKILKNLGIPKLKFHGLRHTFATRCVEASSDYKAISSILGHANITTTLNLYVHPNSEQKKRCIEKMLKSL